VEVLLGEVKDELTAWICHRDRYDHLVHANADLGTRWWRDRLRLAQHGSGNCRTERQRECASKRGSLETFHRGCLCDFVYL
jgi:hypothetical protein